MKYKDEVDHIVSLIKNADKEGLSALALLSKPDEFWLELISVSPQARAWVARRKYLSLSVYLNLCGYAEEDLLICLAANKKAPADTHRFICDFRGEPLRILLELGKPLEDSILIRAKVDADPYIVALAKTRLGEPLDLDLMDRVIAAYGTDFLHKLLTEPKLFRGFTSEALERVRLLKDDRLNEYAKGHE